jgi:hypothetical protein
MLRPLTRDQANAVVSAWHRHHKPVLAGFLYVGAFVEGGGVAGVAIVERPKAAGLCNGTTWEITRVATPNRARCCAWPDNACSMLTRGCWRAAAALGVRRMVTYTRVDESGASYRAAGFVPVARIKGREWAGVNKPGRWLPGLYEASTEIVDRVRWEIGPDAAPAIRIQEAA